MVGVRDRGVVAWCTALVVGQQWIARVAVLALGCVTALIGVMVSLFIAHADTTKGIVTTKDIVTTKASTSITDAGVCMRSGVLALSKYHHHDAMTRLSCQPFVMLLVLT